MQKAQILPWLEPGDPFPDVEQAWGPGSEAPGLLAAGADLGVPRLVDAYSHGIFPWFSKGQPILWWSTEPRMVLKVPDFRLHRSFRKTLQAFCRNPDTEIRVDTAFSGVIRACAGIARNGQNGTWIVPEMVQAYERLHRHGYAHSVETWVQGELVGGLYCVAIGKAVFGESMFARVDEASKIALAALVALCRAHGVRAIDCQQNTPHLASMGAREMPRATFLQGVRADIAQNALPWEFSPLYWTNLLPPTSTEAPNQHRDRP